MSRYVIVSFLEKVEKDMVFSKSEWFLHLTILRPFFSKCGDECLINILKNSLLEKKQIVLVGKSEEVFGPHKDIAVIELEHNAAIQNLYDGIETALKQLIMPESEQYPNYRPHITNQGIKKITVGEKVIINSVSLVKLDNDYRQVLTTINLS